MKHQTALIRIVGTACFCGAIALFNTGAVAQTGEVTSIDPYATLGAAARIAPSTLPLAVQGVQVTLPPLPVTVAVVAANPVPKKTLAVAGTQEVSLTGANSETTTLVGLGLAAAGALLVGGARRRKTKQP